MPLFAQNLLVFLLVAACLAWVGRQAFSALRGRRSKLGSCCAKGCAPPAPTDTASSNRGATKPAVHFIPIDMLSRKK